ncbi:MAG: hypothetical protein IJS68_02920 [Clostridia bacterium]|nr:hypothetical protein [Clostridia bacterium]
MLKIWAKQMHGQKLGKNYVYESLDNYDPETLYLHIAEICHTLDMPTPVILKSHILNFHKFNYATFTKADFVESTDFDSFIIEHVIIK